MTAMSLPVRFEDFLITAKRHCYAGSDDDTSVPRPLLSGSMQLDWREGDWFNWDIYFGMRHFTGIETVYHAAVPLRLMAQQDVLGQRLSMYRQCVLSCARRSKLCLWRYLFGDPF